MKMNLNSKVAGFALGAALTGAVGVLAQTSTQTEKQAAAANNQDNRMCPMMKDGQMNMMSMMKDGQMDMKAMTDCCKKMMDVQHPSADNSSESKPNSEQRKN